MGFETDHRVDQVPHLHDGLSPLKISVSLHRHRPLDSAEVP